jgi:hypothetical protein
MARDRYIARCIRHWHVVLIGADGKETVMEIADSEETAKAEAAKLDREAERIYRGPTKTSLATVGTNDKRTGCPQSREADDRTRGKTVMLSHI